VYPSAYANGYAAQVCNGSKPDFEGQTRNDYMSEPIQRDRDSDLSRWYQEKWVNVCERDADGNYLPCGRSEAKLDKKDYPYCRPLKRLPGTTVLTVNELREDELMEMCRRKRTIEPGVDGKPTRVQVASLSYIQNPTTLRMVKMNGKIGKQLRQHGGATKVYTKCPVTGKFLW